MRMSLFSSDCSVRPFQLYFVKANIDLCKKKTNDKAACVQQEVPTDLTSVSGLFANTRIQFHCWNDLVEFWPFFSIQTSCSAAEIS